MNEHLKFAELKTLMVIADRSRPLSCSVQEVVGRLHLMVEMLLFGTDPWPPEPREVNAALDELGVAEHIDAQGTCCLSLLGKAVDADLFRIWLAGFDPWDAIGKLEERGLICSVDAEEMCECLEAGCDVWPRLRPLLQTSYLTYIRKRLPH